MAQENLGGIYFEVDIETKQMIESSQKAKAELESLAKSAQDTGPGLDKLSKSAKGVASALAMPEVNKLSTQLAQLSGSLGVSSDAATEAAASQNKFHGVLGTVASKLGGGYVSNVGSATSSLIKHAQEALNAVDAQLKNAEAAKNEAESLKEAASQLSIKSEAERKAAESAVSMAESELKAAEAVFERKQADIESLEALLSRQKESLKQSEANLKITNSEKAVAEAVRARNAVDITQNKIIKQSDAAIKEVTAAEDRLTTAKGQATLAAQKLVQARELEAVAASTVAKANDAAAIASERITLATKAQAVAVGGARQALSLLGGPSGILLLAAAGVYSLYQAMSDNSKIEQYKKDIDEAAQKLEYLTRVQAMASEQKTKMSLGLDRQSLGAAKSSLESIRQQIETVKSVGGSSKYLESLKGDLVIAEDSVRKLSESVRVGEERLKSFSNQATTAGDVTQEQASANEIYDKTIKSVTSSNELLNNTLEKGLYAAQEMAAEKELRRTLAENGIAAEETERQVRKLKDAFAERSELTFEQELKSVQSNVEALRIEMTQGKEAAIAYRASIDATNKGYSADQVKEYIAAKQQEFKVTQQIAEQNKKNSASASSSKRDANAAESVAQKLANLKQQSELAADSTRELSREQAILKAQQSLGKAATQDQIKLAGEYAAKTWDVANALKMRQEAEQASRFVNQEVSAAKVQRDPYTGEAVDPYAQINEEESRKLEALRKYQKLGAVDAQQYEDGKTAIMQQAANERINIAQDESRRQVDVMNTLLGGLGDSFSGLADIISKSSGDTSDAYRVLFGIGKGFAVAQAGLNLQLALSNAMASGPFPWNLSAMASVAAAGGSLISSIAGATYGGARKNGGPVSAGEMYRVGEGGMPEIYQASSGRQYMIPGDNGKVISNKDMQGGGGGGAVIHQTVEFHIQTTGGIDDATMAKMSTMMKQVSINTIRDQQRPRGLLERSR